MDDEKIRIGGIPPRWLAAIVGAVVLLSLSILAVAFYRELGSLIRPSYGLPVALDSAQTQDVRVQRGPIHKVLSLASTLQPRRTAKLSLETAQARVLAVPVSPGVQVSTGQILVQLDEAALQRELARARSELVAAQQELEAVTAKGALAKRIELEDDLREARRTLVKAQRELQRFHDGKDTPEARRTQAAAELEVATIELIELSTSQVRAQQIDQLLVSYNEAEVKHGPYVLIVDPSEQDLDTELILRNDMLDKLEQLEQARLQYDIDLRAARQKVVTAERTLQGLDRAIAAGSSEVELAKRQAAVQQELAKVNQLLAELAALDEGTPDPDVAKARAKVVKLQGQASEAEAAVAEAVVVAPFDGVVDDVRAIPGMMAAPGTELMTLFDLSVLHARAQVNDIDIAQLAAGQEARVTLDAFPGIILSGKVGEIPDFGVYENGMTLFEVLVALGPSELPLRMGMGATVSVPLFLKEDVVIVPLMAVQKDEEGAFVIVVEGRKSIRRRVRTGISDGIHIEVVEGLDQGEVVRILVQAPVTYR